MVNSMSCDCSSRQLSTSVRYRSLGKRSKYSAASFLAAVRSLVNFSKRESLPPASPQDLGLFPNLWV